MSAKDRPTFKELLPTISNLLEQTAGYLQLGFSPCKEVVEMEDGTNEWS